jgi:glycosyltransferase involved in cell wall biosynthesis
MAIHKPVTVKEKLIFHIARYIPFTFFRRRYRRLLRSVDKVIANSNTTATLLHILYGIEPQGVVYPPVDTSIFRPRNVAKKNQVLLYLGSHAGDTDPDLLRKICKVLEGKGIRTVTLGNKTIAEKLSRECSVKHVSGVSDEDLARIYSESIATICPQKWEQFGYVAAESIACGTPVIAYNIMGPAEIIRITGTGILVDNSYKLMDIIKNLNDHLMFRNSLHVHKNNIYPFDIKESTRIFLEILNRKPKNHVKTTL